MLRNQKRPRIDPVEPPYDEDTGAALEGLGPPLAVFRLFARKPARARAIHGWGRYYLSKNLSLSLRHRELVILRTTALCGSSYEWGVHVTAFGDKVGLSGDQVDSTASGSPADQCWNDPSDAAVLRAVDALVLRHDLDDDEWADLTTYVDHDAALDLLLLCGWYHAISFVTAVPRLAPEPGAAVLPDHQGARP